MIDDEAFNAFCGGLRGTTYVCQWGGAHVWKVGGKVFAVGGWNSGRLGITFKVSDIAFEMLKDAPGLRPAPYMASRGLPWLQCHEPEGMPDADLLDLVQASYDLVAAKLPRRTKASLGIPAG